MLIPRHSLSGDEERCVSEYCLRWINISTFWINPIVESPLAEKYPDNKQAPYIDA